MASELPWAEIASETCSVARTAELFGDRWMLLVLRDLMNGVHRFDTIQGHLGIARDVLTRRLATLVEHGLVERVPYREPGARVRYEYRLTAAGRELRTVFVALMAWGDRHLAGQEGPPVIVEHKDCGAPVSVRLVCDAGHDATKALHLRPGPGARRRTG